MIPKFYHNTSLCEVIYIYIGLCQLRIAIHTHTHTHPHTHTHKHTHTYINIYIYLFTYLFIAGLEILSSLCIFKNLLKFVNCIVREGLK